MRDVSPSALISSMEEVYRSLRTYKNEGTISNVHLKEGSREEVSASYALCFVRGGGVRLDHHWQDPPSDGWPRRDFTVWGDERTANVFKRDKVSEQSLRQTLIEEVLLESPILPVMIGLLLPGQLRFEELITTLRNLKHTGTEVVGAHSCHVIVGHTDKIRQDEFTLFLDRENSLICDNQYLS